LGAEDIWRDLIATGDAVVADHSGPPRTNCQTMCRSCGASRNRNESVPAVVDQPSKLKQRLVGVRSCDLLDCCQGLGM
jgi:hypothetical protein